MAAAREAELRVVDPAGAPVAGALVSVACGAHSSEQLTDATGSAHVSADSACMATVTAPGFAAWRGTLDQAAGRTVALAIARISQSIVVEAPAPALWAPLAHSSITRDDLALAGWNSETALRIARARAGTGLTRDSLYVDGLPASRLPAATGIQQIEVNADPFSVLFSESDQNIVEVTSSVPDRTFRWAFGTSPGHVGARNPLRRDTNRTVKQADARVSGAVPWTPLAFSVDANGSFETDERPVFSAFDPSQQSAGADRRTRTIAAAIDGQWSPRVRTRFNALLARSSHALLDSGGFTRAESATTSASDGGEVRFVLDADAGTHRVRSGVVYSDDASRFSAATTAIGITVLDASTEGGAMFRALDIERRNWMWSADLADASGRWRHGWSLRSDGTREEMEPNPAGSVLFGTPAEYERARAGQAGGTWSRAVGIWRRHERVTTGAAFSERKWTGSRNAFRAGARVDYQTGGGLAVSPRLTSRTTLGPLSLQSAVGLFRETWSPDTLIQAERFSPHGSSSLLIGDALWSENEWLGSRLEPVRTGIAGELATPLAWTMREGAELHWPRSKAGIEYTWTAGTHRLGSRRLRVEDGWLDFLESNRRLRRHHVHGRGEYRVGGFSAAANVEWLLSRDDSDGPFSFPERQDALAAEWARSAGLSPLTVSVVGDLPAMRQIRTVLVFSKRSSAPMNVRTGLDREGAHLYTDRGGLARNAGAAPGYESLDVYAFRRLRMPLFRGSDGQLMADASLSGENLLNARNVAAVGSVLGSPFYGVPVAASPGRTIRVSVRLAP